MTTIYGLYFTFLHSIVNWRIFILVPKIFLCLHKGLFNFIVLLAPWLSLTYLLFYFEVLTELCLYIDVTEWWTTATSVPNEVVLRLLVDK